MYVISLQELQYWTKWAQPWQGSQLEADIEAFFLAHGYARLVGAKRKRTNLIVYVAARQADKYTNPTSHVLDLDPKPAYRVVARVRKAAVALQFIYLGVSFAFVGAHFTAQSNERRLEDFHWVMEEFGRDKHLFDHE
jgi:hypothetical protein